MATIKIKTDETMDIPMDRPVKRLVGLTWQDVRTGRMQCQKTKGTTLQGITHATIIKALNFRVWAKGALFFALAIILALAFTAWLDGWTFYGHTPQFWMRLHNAIFYQAQ